MLQIKDTKKNTHTKNILLKPPTHKHLGKRPGIAPGEKLLIGHVKVCLSVGVGVLRPDDDVEVALEVDVGVTSLLNPLHALAGGEKRHLLEHFLVQRHVGGGEQLVLRALC